MIVGELRIIPVGGSSSMEDAVETVVEKLDTMNVKYDVGPLGTTIETDDIDRMFEAVKAAHTSLQGQVPRVVTSFTIDHRMDKEETAESLTQVNR